MESKMFAAIVLIFVVTSIADLAAADRKLKAIRLEILNMKKSFNDLETKVSSLETKVLKPIGEMEFKLGKLEIAVEENRFKLEEVQRQVNGTGATAIAESGSIDNGVVQQLQERLNKQTEELKQIHTDLSNERNTRLDLTIVVENNSKLLKSQNDLISTIELIFSKNKKDSLQRVSNSLKAAFSVEKEQLRNMSLSFINDTKLAKKDFMDFTESVNKSVEGLKDDITRLKSQTTEHEEKMKTILKKMVDLNETIAVVELKASQNEIILKNISDCPSPSVENGVTDPPTGVTHGTVILVTCNSGYRRIGNHTVTCNNGVFDDLPLCKRIPPFTDMRVVNRSSFNINLEDDSTPGITGSVFLPDDRLVLCDYRNNILKLLSSTFTITDSLTLQSGPRDVAAVNSSSVIVTLPYPEQLQYVYVLPSLQRGSTIDLEKRCRGIVIMEEEIYLTCHNWGKNDGEVRVLSLDGRLKRRLGVDEINKYMFKYPDYITVSQVTKNIYVSDYRSQQVTCLSSDGSILYEYTDPELRGPRGMFVDIEDNIIVCGRYSNNLQVITAGGKRHSTLLTSSDGISQPYTVSLRHSDTTLIVGSFRSDNVLVFKLSP